jgi:hypothetical protein
LSYIEIFIIGWNLNGMMFVLNLIIAFGTVHSNDSISLHKETEQLKELKEKFDSLYPNRQYDVYVSYIFPFMAFFRTSFRLFEMMMFFRANQGTRMYDFIVYKYEKDIAKLNYPKN